jgi:hypothetical protein
MNPFYSSEEVTLYEGDCRIILPNLDLGKYVLITDPVWPNALKCLEGSDRPYDLLDEMWRSVQELPVRAAIHLGTNSDPRILASTPSKLNFFRTVYLSYSVPGRKGRLLQGNDTAYLFGPPPKSRPGARLIPSVCNVGQAGKETKHPCPRKLKHVSWLVSFWSEPDDIIIDPFCGSGTTLLAAKNLGRKAIGIEISPEYCALTVERLGQGVLDLFRTKAMAS